MKRKPTISTKEALIDAAIRVLAAHPTATLAEIADSAGVKRVTLHRLIGTREDLLRDIALRSLKEMDAACYAAAEDAETAFETLRAIVAVLVPLADRVHFLWNDPSAWEDDTVAEQISRHDRELSQLIDQAKVDGDIAMDVPTAWIIASLNAILFAALSASRGGDIAANDASDLAVRTLFHGIANPGKPSGTDRKQTSARSSWLGAGRRRRG